MKKITNSKGERKLKVRIALFLSGVKDLALARCLGVYIIFLDVLIWLLRGIAAYAAKKRRSA